MAPPTGPRGTRLLYNPANFTAVSKFGPCRNRTRNPADQASGWRGRTVEVLSMTEVAAVTVLGLMLSLCVLVALCLRGSTPEQRPAILRALSDVLRSLWPWYLPRSRPVRHRRPRSTRR